MVTQKNVKIEPGEKEAGYKIIRPKALSTEKSVKGVGISKYLRMNALDKAGLAKLPSYVDQLC